MSRGMAEIATPAASSQPSAHRWTASRRPGNWPQAASEITSSIVAESLAMWPTFRTQSLGNADAYFNDTSTDIRRIVGEVCSERVEFRLNVYTGGENCNSKRRLLTDRSWTRRPPKTYVDPHRDKWPVGIDRLAHANHFTR